MTESRPRIRIVIADDHPIFRDGLRRLLEVDGRFEVVGEASDGREAVDRVTALAPDILILDLAMPRCSGLRALERLAELHSPVRTVVLTAVTESFETARALRLGARGLILKVSAAQLLFTGLVAVMDGELWVERDQFGGPPAPGPQGRTPPAETLTPRELQVIAAVVDGASNPEIALELEVSEHTIRHHLRSIFDKIGVSTRLELALYAVHHGLVERLSDGADGT
jgi:two-component system, NarL family, nitrate/nitrite response regulator NarL